MKSIELLVAMKQCNKKLSANAVRNYWTVVSLVVNGLDAAPDELKKAVASRDFIKCLDITDAMSSQLYDDSYMHYVAAQLSSLFKKYPFEGVEEILKPEEAAMKKFDQAELKCRRVNHYLRMRRKYGRNGKLAPDFDKMRAFIRYVLGDEPNFESIWSKAGFGPGASIGIHGNATNGGRKLSAPYWSVSPGASHYFLASVSANLFTARAITPDGTHELYFGHRREAIWDRLEFVDYNKIAFVPKTVRTYRSIAVEPLGNGFVQKGIGEEIRLRLKRAGIDLKDQSRNQRMAREGSLDNSTESFVTVDLSSASDSIAVELCRELLPPAWFDLLNACRSKTFVYATGNEKPRRYEKFASMGNGFCFPLESLIFAAVCVSIGAGVPRKDFSVYGDDIIVRQRFAKVLYKALRYCGFTVNREKSHVNGPFRESCGADYFGGVDVRPYYLKAPLDSVQAIYKHLNLTAAKPLWSDFWAPARNYVLGLLKEKLRLYRPFTGPWDTAINSTDEYLTSPSCCYKGNGSWAWTELASSARFDPVVEEREAFRYPLEWYEAHNSREGASCYTLRLTSRTNVVRKYGAGAWSNWVPVPGLLGGVEQLPDLAS